MKTDTPRTDAAKIERSRINGPPYSGADGGSVGFEFVVTVEFAERLERELNQLRSALEGMSEMCDNYFEPSGLVCQRDREIWAKHLDALRLCKGHP